MLLQFCLASMVVVELTGMVDLVEALKESNQTEKLQPRVWKRLRVEDHSGRNHADAMARRAHQDDEAYVPVEDRTGVGSGHLGMRRPTSPGCA